MVKLKYTGVLPYRFNVNEKRTQQSKDEQLRRFHLLFYQDSTTDFAFQFPFYPPSLFWLIWKVFSWQVDCLVSGFLKRAKSKAIIFPLNLPWKYIFSCDWYHSLLKFASVWRMRYAVTSGSLCSQSIHPAYTLLKDSLPRKKKKSTCFKILF